MPNSPKLLAPVLRESVRHSPSAAQLLRKQADSPQIITLSPTGRPLSRPSSRLSGYLRRSPGRYINKSLRSLFPLWALRQRWRLLRRGWLGPSRTICTQTQKATIRNALQSLSRSKKEDKRKNQAAQSYSWSMAMTSMNWHYMLRPLSHVMAPVKNCCKVRF